MKILDYMIKARNGHYCHALELTDAYDLECVIENFIAEFVDKFTLSDYLEFFNSIEIYFIADNDSTNKHNAIMEEELYNANISELVTEAFNGM